MTFSSKLLFNDLSIFILCYGLTIVFAVSLPPLLIYRVFVVMCKKLFRPDLESIVSGMDLIFSKDIGLWDKKPEEIIVAVVTLNSVLSYEKVETFFKDVLTQKNNDRLFQYMVPWMGFGFWKREISFSLEKHISVVNNEEVQDEKWLSSFTKKLLRKPFGNMLSPWEVYIVSNYEPSPGIQNQSAFIFRYHHCLVDGHSCIKLFANAYDNYIPIKYENSNISHSIMQNLTNMLLSPYTSMKFYLENTDWNAKHWTNYTGEMCAASTKIQLEKIYLIKQKYKVGFHPIVYAGVSTAVRKIFLRTKSEIPQKIHIGIPMPKPNHPEYLCNHFNAMSFPLPVRVSDPLERLLSINSDYDRIMNSNIPELIDVAQDVVGYTPYLIPHNLIPIQVSANVSIVPLGAQNEFLGCPIDEYHNSFPVPVSHTNTGMVILGLMNNGCLHLRGTFDSSILASDEMAKETMECIDEYFNSLLLN